MPTYQYECSACGYAFEELQSMNDAKLTDCPQCNESKLHRLIGTGSGIIFKGNGFYETDYKKSSSAATHSGAAPAKEPAAGTGSAKETPASNS